MRRGNVRDRGGGRRNTLLIALAAGLALLAPAVARANGDGVGAGYTTRQIVQSGVVAGGVPIPASYDLYLGGLSDTGKIIFTAGTLNQGAPERLFQYAGRTFTPIVMPASGPAGAWSGDVYWPADVTVARPVSVNARGNAVFAAGRVFGTSPFGTFMWNAAAGHTTAVALKEMPATGDLTFASPGGYAPAINSSNEVAIVAQVVNPVGSKGWGVFRLGRDGVLAPVVRPHEPLTLTRGEGSYIWDTGAGQISITEYPMPSIDDNGRVAFLAHPDGSGRQNAYLWDHGAVTPILTYGAGAPNGGKFTSIIGVFLNSRNAWALVVAATDRDPSGTYGLYRVVNGQAALVAAPGQTMPDGTALQTVQYVPTSDFAEVPSVAVSAASSLGEHVFLATLADGRPAAYKIDSNGGMKLVVKGGESVVPIHVTATTPPVTTAPMSFVTGSRPSINRGGQVAFTARFGNGPAVLVLMTPSS